MKIHLIPVVVYDFEGYGLSDCAALLENVRHLGHTHVQLDQAQTAEVEWSDDHPLNQTATAKEAIAKLFPDQWQQAVCDALLPLEPAETPRATVAKLVQWEQHLATTPALQQPTTEAEHKALMALIAPKTFAVGIPSRVLPNDFQWFAEEDSSFPRFNLKAEPQYESYVDVEPGHFYGLLMASGKCRIFYRGFHDCDIIPISEVDNMEKACDFLRASLGTKPEGVDFPPET